MAVRRQPIGRLCLASLPVRKKVGGSPRQSLLRSAAVNEMPVFQAALLAVCPIKPKTTAISG